MRGALIYRFLFLGSEPFNRVEVFVETGALIRKDTLFKKGAMEKGVYLEAKTQ